MSKAMFIIIKACCFKQRREKQSRHGDRLSRWNRLRRQDQSVFVYGHDRYEAISSEKLLIHQRRGGNQKESVRHGDFLADEFMPCNVGIQGLHYDRTTRSLLVPKRSAGVIRVKREIKHRLQMLIRASAVLPELES